MSYELRTPANDAEWSAYHRIRRAVLFDRRGQGASYDPSHPDEHAPGHHPLILWYNSEPLGVIRIDIDGPTATLRRVALREEHQGRGHGRVLLKMAEDFTRARGVRQLESHVDAGAVMFYERCGFYRSESEEPRAGSVFMTKLVNEVA